MTRRVPLPPQFAEASRRFATSGAQPVPPRTAATVMLLRPSTVGPEVYLQRRVSTMAFAPSMYVFPGGSVDPRDAERSVAWAGPGLDVWSTRLGLPPADARALVCAAVREVFEECGVLLAGPDESTVVGDLSGAEWEADRVALLSRDIALAEMLAARGLMLRGDLLAPFARWVTPEFEPRRFDTYFFVARLPADQVTRDVGGEADHSLWVRPSSALELPMLPPTAHQLGDLAAYASVDEALAASSGRVLTTPVMPHLEVDDDGAWLVM